MAQKDQLGFIADVTGSSGSPTIVLEASSGGAVVVPGGAFLLQADYAREGADLVLTGDDGARVVIQDYFSVGEAPTLLTEGGARITPPTAQALAGSLAPGQYAESSSAGAEPTAIGQVENLDGTATAIRADGSRVQLREGAELFQGDVLETDAGATLSVEFVDESNFALGESGRLVIDELVFDADRSEGSSAISIVQGVFTFVSGEIAHNNSGEMVVTTPVATIGVRGTRVAGRASAEGERNTFTLLQQEDGSVGEITVTNDAGTVVLNQANQTTMVASYSAAPIDPVVLPAAAVNILYQQVTTAGPGAGTPGSRGGDDRDDGASSQGGEHGADGSNGEGAPQAEGEAAAAGDGAEGEEEFALGEAIEGPGINAGDSPSDGDEPQGEESPEGAFAEAVAAGATNDEAFQAAVDAAVAASPDGTVTDAQIAAARAAFDAALTAGADPEAALAAAAAAVGQMGQLEGPGNPLGTGIEGDGPVVGAPTTVGGEVAGFGPVGAGDSQVDRAYAVAAAAIEEAVAQGLGADDIMAAAAGAALGELGVVEAGEPLPPEVIAAFSTAMAGDYAPGQGMLVASVAVIAMGGALSLHGINTPFGEVGPAAPGEAPDGQSSGDPAEGPESLLSPDLAPQYGSVLGPGVLAIGPEFGYGPLADSLIDPALIDPLLEPLLDTIFNDPYAEGPPPGGDFESHDLLDEEGPPPDANFILGTAGDDTLTGTNAVDAIHGGSGNDVLTALGAGDFLAGGPGADTISGNDGNDNMIGGSGDDSLFGGPGNDHLDGDDRITGDGDTAPDGNDQLDGGAGDDELDGDGGSDTVLGGDGNDSIHFEDGEGFDTVDGGTGTDVFFAEASDVSATRFVVSDSSGSVFLQAGPNGSETSQAMIDNVEIFEFIGFSFFEELVVQNVSGTTLTNISGLGGGGNDTLNAVSGGVPVFFSGDGGDDVLLGGSAIDSLVGGPGNDALVGNLGVDSLTGGSGTDVFKYESTSDGGVVASDVAKGSISGDFIADFLSGTDKFEFLGSPFLLTPGSLSAGNFADIGTPEYDGTNSGVSSGTPVFIYDGTDTLYYDADTATPGYSVIAELQPGAQVTVSDIEIVGA